MIAALFVERGGAYWNLPDVDCWDEERDARLYAGPYPAVAHPPCQRWGKMWFGQPLWVKRTGERKKLGDDDGCFEASLGFVRKWGGGDRTPGTIARMAPFRIERTAAIGRLGNG